ncbi:MAG: Dam family site-specific DNA-(adenine-N6)-methyltransferase [Alloprevotella sp.]|nr:Dam family site-specific DNA-(adenine-N6)-methyltransferase [Alloprevotella sp.]
MAKAKPFIKWAGGKGQLLEQLDAYLPEDFGDRRNVTYIEPFIGGGAMLFYMLQRYPNIQHAVINDVNPDLTTCYQTVRDTPEELIVSLLDIQNAYNALQTEDGRRDFFLAARDRYNEKDLDPIENTTKFIFLNRTCFNGLYRVNKKGLFNVPFGKYVNPQICDPATIRLDSELLQRVEILTGDFEATLDHVGDGYNFFYFDPPYRPLNATSSFNSYSKEDFNDDEQIRLRDFCARLNSRLGIGWMLSNADCSAKNPEDTFFERVYGAYRRTRLSGRDGMNYIIIRNYPNQ